MTRPTMYHCILYNLLSAPGQLSFEKLFSKFGCLFGGEKFLEIWVGFQRFQVSKSFSRIRGFIILKSTNFEKVSRIIFVKSTSFEIVSRIISIATFGPE
jgi:hypothetical protein